MALQEGHRLYTSADLRALEALPENADKKFELIAGEIFEVPTGTPTHAHIIAEILMFLKVFVNRHALGYAFADSVTYFLDELNEFIPDVSYISKQRLPTLPDKLHVAPNLAVEVVSPSNLRNWGDFMDKIIAYLQHGTEMVWVVFPEKLRIDVYRLEADGSFNVRILTIEDTLEGGDVLPGLSIPVREVFPSQSAA
ncbi:MAG: hypothetical protein DPW16_22650 [Chloroflexi bacterium]|nr:hypothetical protein [Chloroflexota bacterium]